MDLMTYDIMTHAKHMTVMEGWLTGQIELTSVCACKCPHCESWKDHKSGKMCAQFRLPDAIELTQRIISISPYLTTIRLTGGDPLCWEHFENYLKAIAHMRRQPNGRVIQLQVTTALRSAPDLVSWRYEAWQGGISKLRVSLDAMHPETMKIVRGVEYSGEEIFERINHLRIPTNIYTVVSEETVPEIAHMADAVEACPWVKKHILTPRLDKGPGAVVDWGTIHNWWKFRMEQGECKTQIAMQGFNVPLENDTVCWAQRVHFHIKANGDFYGCCLMGGEAIETDERFCFGNVHELPLEEIHARVKASYLKPYGDWDHFACHEVCLLKQRLANHHCSNADKINLSLP